MAYEFTSLQQLLDHIAKTARHRKRISLDMVVRAVGQRSFAPLLLLVGIILFSPLSGIPGLPTTMALLVLLVAVQLLLGRKHFWMPGWILHRSISKARLIKALYWLQSPTRVIDRWLHPRLRLLVGRTGTYVIAIICVVIALVLPIMEVVPFSATAAGLTLTAFGLALVAQDGLLAMLAFVFTTATFGLVILALI
ncbi:MULTISPECIES: exopolysaccharide biosynthesis protein [unclassified Microbulbifer]|uniref:exopolysaccharide biosynthesis protein n=1 Tax=unclassified Microbulbifer TaxID=2619833 RepID=UPI0027E3FF16|nr:MULTISPECIES: exopolysaccharide biosynthesis protein [unclassified Microbulbifer]